MRRLRKCNRKRIKTDSVKLRVTGVDVGVDVTGFVVVVVDDDAMSGCPRTSSVASSSENARMSSSTLFNDR